MRHRDQRPLARAFGIATLLALASCSGTMAPSPKAAEVPESVVTAGPPFVAPGERVSYRVSVHRVTVAVFTIIVGEPTRLEGRSAIPVQAGAETAGVAALLKRTKIEFATWLDTTSGAPLLFRVTEPASKDDTTVEASEARFTELADGAFPVVTSRDDAEDRIVEQQTVRGVPSDLLTVLMSLRAWDEPVGARRTVDAMRSRYMWRSKLTIAARESVVTELGQLPSVRFDAVTTRIRRDGTVDTSAEPRKFSIWVSDDADRVPIQLVAATDYGDVHLELVDYTAGTGPNLATRGR